MKTTTKMFALAVMTVGVVCAQAQEVTLRRTFTEGQVEKFRIVSQISTSTDLSSMGQGEMSMDIDSSMDATYTFGKTDDKGNALLSFIFSNIETKMEGPMAEMMGSMGGQMPREIKGTGKMDAFGRIFDTKVEGASAGMMQMMTGGSNVWDVFAFVNLPEKPVAVGGSWEFEIPTMNMFEKGSKLSGKLIGAGKVEDRDVWNLEFTGSPKMNMDIGKMMQENPAARDSGMPPMNMVMEGTSKMKITVSVDQKTGQLVSMSSAAESVAKVKLVDMGMEFPTSSQAVTRISLRK